LFVLIFLSYSLCRHIFLSQAFQQFCGMRLQIACKIFFRISLKGNDIQPVQDLRFGSAPLVLGSGQQVFMPGRASRSWHISQRIVSVINIPYQYSNGSSLP
jgi:hypothetical protein